MAIEYLGWDRPDIIAYADQLDAEYNEKILAYVGNIVEKIREHGPGSSSMEGYHIYKACLDDEGTVDLDMISELSFMFAASVLKLAQISIELSDAAERFMTDGG